MDEATRNRRYQIKDVARLFNVTPRRVESWCESDLLHPVVDVKLGAGSRREFDVGNLISIVVVQELQHLLGEKTKILPRFGEWIKEQGRRLPDLFDNPGDAVITITHIKGPYELYRLNFVHEDGGKKTIGAANAYGATVVIGLAAAIDKVKSLIL